MTHKDQICLAGAVIGASVGAAVAYFYLTDEGARRRAQIARACERLTIDAEEGHRLWLRLHEAWTEFNRGRDRSFPHWAGGRQSWTPEDAA